MKSSRQHPLSVNASSPHENSSEQVDRRLSAHRLRPARLQLLFPPIPPPPRLPMSQVRALLRSLLRNSYGTQSNSSSSNSSGYLQRAHSKVRSYRRRTGKHVHHHTSITISNQLISNCGDPSFQKAPHARAHIHKKDSFGNWQ